MEKYRWMNKDNLLVIAFQYKTIKYLINNADIDIYYDDFRVLKDACKGFGKPNPTGSNFVGSLNGYLDIVQYLIERYPLRILNELIKVCINIATLGNHSNIIEYLSTFRELDANWPSLDSDSESQGATDDSDTDIE